MFRCTPSAVTLFRAHRRAALQQALKTIETYMPEQHNKDVVVGILDRQIKALAK